MQRINKSGKDSNFDEFRNKPYIFAESFYFMMMKHGIVVIDKPAGISSAKLVSRVKKTLCAKKAGHAGTLDPFATGVIVCGINKGTKLSRFFLGGDKKYTGTIQLGLETDTLDSTGRIVKQADKAFLDSISVELISEIVQSFKGSQKQNPPVYSALKHKGQPLYRFARQGIEIRKPARDIEIFSIEVKKIDLPFVTIDVHCSSGTYIRSLAHDIGAKIGCGGSLFSLVRTYACGFSIEDAVSLAEFENMDKERSVECVIPLADALLSMPSVSVSDRIIDKIRFGQKIDMHEGLSSYKGAYVKIIDKNGELAAVMEYDKKHAGYNYCCVFIS